jgi:hippurate hydrolase
VRDQVVKKINEITESTAKAHGCTAEVDITYLYPATINHTKEADHIRRVANTHFGGVSEEDLPIMASEDFSYFLNNKPGAFFVLGTKRKDNETLHSSTYDFNDTCLATGGLFWVRLIEDRLGVHLINA